MKDIDVFSILTEYLRCDKLYIDWKGIILYLIEHKVYFGIFFLFYTKTFIIFQPIFKHLNRDDEVNITNGFCIANISPFSSSISREMFINNFIKYVYLKNLTIKNLKLVF